jgi:hypothetical protein
MSPNSRDLKICDIWFQRRQHRLGLVSETESTAVAETNDVMLHKTKLETPLLTARLATQDCDGTLGTNKST